MNKIIAISLFAFIISTNSTLAQSTEATTSFTENTPDSVLFQTYLDTVSKAYIALEQKDIKTAWAGYLTAREIATELENPLHLDNCEFLKAEIYKKEGLPERALAIYQFFIGKDSKESLAETRDLLVNTYKTCELMGDYTQAYEYLLALNEVKEKIAEEKKMQQMEYLKIKFEAAEKDKENAVLTAQVLHKQSEQQLLFGIIALFLISICFLIGAFFQKRKYNRRLRIEVAKQTQALHHSNRELDEFNRIFSHDLKEPLRSIVGFSTLASKAVFGNERATEYLGYIEKNGRQLHQIIENVSTFRNIDGYAESPPEWIDTEQLLDYISTSDDLQLDGKMLRLEKGDLRKIYANRSFLYLIFKNLLENGIKYNEHAEVLVNVAYEKTNGQHVFRFTDNGIGIAKEYHEKIFQMFKRLNDRGAYDGSGLGLSIVKKMLEKANGSIALVASEEGRGSTFEVCLPIAAVEETWARKRRMMEQV